MLLEVKRARSKQRGKERQALKKEALNVSGLRQPESRAIRYDDVRSAMAEEGVIRLLFLDGSLADRCGDLAPEDFSSPLLGKIYGEQLQAAREGRTPAPALLQEALTTEEMGHLTALLQKPESLAAADKSLPDYIEIIRQSAAKRTGGPQEDPLLAAKDKFKEKKGYGGKRHV